MLRRLRESFFGVGRRISAVGTGFVDTFLRDNKVIPVVLALLALFVFAWVVAGAFLGSPDEEPVSNRAEVAQSRDESAPADPVAPEIENRNADSYAAYQFKDPFRQLVAPAETTTTTTPTPTTTPTTTPDDGQGGNGGGGGGGGGLDASDSDGDGLSDRREFDLSLDPANPDSDGDGTLDGQDDEAQDGGDGDGGTGNGGANGGDRGDNGRGGQNGGLPQSGGDIPLR